MALTNRDRIYKIQENEKLSTFQYDENLPSLPLPKLEDTMKRYFESLKPFGTKEELEKSSKVIEEFEKGIGKTLHETLSARAKTHRNWLEKWWEDYAYHTLQMPLYPYSVMAMPVLLESVFVPETHKDALRVLARVSYHTLEFWDLIRKEKLRPAASKDGKVKFSSKLYKRFYNCARIPGVEQDKIFNQFQSVSEGSSPSNGIVISRGRIFKFGCLNEDKTILSAQQLLNIFEIIRARTDADELGQCVPVLTCDERPGWAKNRQYLQELSPENKEFIKYIEGSCLMVTLDENEPSDYSEVSAAALSGDFYSKWCDKTSVICSFKNGRMACIGEHSAYDGTISISYALFILLSLAEYAEPNWEEHPGLLPYLSEISFVLDEYIETEIKRVIEDSNARRNDVLVSHDIFDSFGKEYLKQIRIHPDAFVQMIIQLVYYKIHKEITATYETALMRHYYNGRTETLRSCTMKVVEFINTAMNPKSTHRQIFESLKVACEHHNWLMEEARKGNGVDRHLFGLWCVAYEKGIDTPELYSDPLYLKSGGGGNFVLSTSTLGYSISNGYVAPMVMDGYGVFYSFTSESIQLLTSTYKASPKTSAMFFNEILKNTFLELKNIIDAELNTKLKL